MYKFNKAEVLLNGSIQLRQQEVLELADGTQREGKYRRVAYTPDMDINSIECDRCKALATATWTPQVISQYKASIVQDKLLA
jgi:hypothetical protein